MPIALLALYQEVLKELLRYVVGVVACQDF